jgi:hypothetical protein
MNKSRKRAIQKHRAKEAKFEIRRKTSGEQADSKAKGGVGTAAQARQRTAPRRQSGEAGE